MAESEDDRRKRRREREDEQDREAEARVAKIQGKISAANPSSQEIDSLLHQGEVLIEQLDRLYQSYFQGIERLPPIQKRKQLDDLILQIDKRPKPTTQIQFKVQTVRNKYNTYRDRWDRKIKDIENGRIKRG